MRDKLATFCFATGAMVFILALWNGWNAVPNPHLTELVCVGLTTTIVGTILTIKSLKEP